MSMPLNAVAEAPACRHSACVVRLRGRAAVDVLVEPAGVRARVAREATIGVLRPALLDIGSVGVAVVTLPRVIAGHHITPVGPDAVREGVNRTDVEIVAAERNRAAAELLPSLGCS